MGADNWNWCCTIHSDLWALDLSHQEILAYAYLNSFCHKEYRISLLIMAKTLRMDTKRLKCAIDSLISRNMVKKTKLNERSCAYQITMKHIKSWGQLPPCIGSNAPMVMGANAPIAYGQTPLLTTTLKEKTHGSLDHTFLEIFDSHFKKWQFNRKPVGRFHSMTRGMQTRALECMRWLHKNGDNFSTPERFHTFLSGVGEYLSLDRDVLSPTKDQRALSPGKWLHDWPEQIRLAGIYMDEKEQKITRIETGSQE